MENIKLSIIIPAWNTENYIEKAIQSCLSQKYDNIEIIVVDDASTDQTADIVERICGKDARVRLLRQSHGGVSKARNTALQTITGQYVVFVDSDDWLEENVLNELLEYQLQYENYLISCNTYSVKSIENGKYQKQTTHLFEEPVVLQREEAIQYTGQPIYHNSSVNKIFDANVIKENNLQFDEQIAFGEDGLFVLDYLLCVEGMVYIDKPYWNILDRPGSATRCDFSERDMTSLYVIDRMLKRLENHSSEVIQNMCLLYVECALDMYKRYVSSNAVYNKKMVREIRNYIEKNRKIYFEKTNNLYDRVKTYAVLYVPFKVYRKLFLIKEKIRK